MQARAEAVRQEIATAYGSAGPQPEETFDRLADMAAEIFSAPIALVSLLSGDQIWFKSHRGMEMESVPIASTLCERTLQLSTADELLIVEDARSEPRFATSPFVLNEPYIRFFVGAPLTGSDGSVFGVLCVADSRPHELPSNRKLDQLRALAKIISGELELRRARVRLAEKQRLLDMGERLSGVGHWRFDPVTRQVDWSDQVFMMHGVAPGSFTPRAGAALVYRDQAEALRVATMSKAAIAAGSGFETNIHIRRPDGEERELVCRGDCMFDDDGRVVSLCGVFLDVTDQKQELARIARSTARYNLLARNIADSIVTLDLDGLITFASPSAGAILGRSVEQLTGRDVLDFIDPQDRDPIDAAIQLLKHGAGEAVLEHRVVRQSGQAVWVETRLRTMQDPDRASPEILVVSRDIDERRALEAVALEAREAAEAAARRAEVAEAVAGLGHWRMDLRTGEVILSAELHRIYGLPQGAPVDLSSLSALLHPDDRAGVLERLEAAMAGRDVAVASSRFLRNGEIRFLEGAQRQELGPDGEPVAVLGTLQDVTERRRAEQAIRDSEEQLRLMAETVNDVIAHVDENAVFTYVSPSSRRLLGYEPEELVGRTFMTLLHADDADLLLATIPKSRADGDTAMSLTIEFRMIHKDGHEIWFEGRPVVTYDPVTGETTGATDVLRDITARKALEAELRAAQAAAEQATVVKSEFLANMSHELRTPLTSIIGFTSLAAEQPDLSTNTRAYVDRVAEASQALLCTVNDILDFSKLEAGQVAVEPQPTSLARLVRATLDLFTPQAGAKDLALVLESEGDPDVVVQIDPDRTRQILLNLVGNAVKFTKLGGVTVRTRHDPIAGELFVAVADTGEGIPPDRLDRLFKRFSQVDGSLTRSHGGTGLGLAICKGLVEAMGGEIGVESQDGQGSCFWFRIPAPLADLPESRDEQDEAPDRALLEGVRVLVVDDHPANRELARLFLEGMGAEVAEAEDGEIAVARAETETWDVIVMDVRMPRLDGPGALRRIREGSGANRETPILAFTADADVESLQRVEAVGFQGVVAKPVDPSLLILAVARVLAA